MKGTISLSKSDGGARLPSWEEKLISAPVVLKSQRSGTAST